MTENQAFIPLVLWTVIAFGCAAEHRAITLSADHPASVDAAEAPYVPPASVLFGERTDTTPEPTTQPTSPGTTHEHHGMLRQPASTPGMDEAVTGNLPTTQPQQVEAAYACPMHPEVVKNTPGKCPLCGMKLVKKQNNGGRGSRDGGHHE